MQLYTCNLTEKFIIHVQCIYNFKETTQKIFFKLRNIFFAPNTFFEFIHDI